MPFDGILDLRPIVGVKMLQVIGRLGSENYRISHSGQIIAIFYRQIKQSKRPGRIVAHLSGAERANRIQKVAVEKSRLGIPLIFGLDVIHGFRTIFPISLAEAASWDPELVEKSAHIAAEWSAQLLVSADERPCAAASHYGLNVEALPAG